MMHLNTFNKIGNWSQYLYIATFLGDSKLCKGKNAGDRELKPNSETYITCLSDGQCIQRWCQATGLVYSGACGSCNEEYIGRLISHLLICVQ